MSTGKGSSHPTPKKLPFAMEKTTTETHNWPKCREGVIVGCSVPGDAPAMQLLYPGLRKNWGRRNKI